MNRTPETLDEGYEGLFAAKAWIAGLAAGLSGTLVGFPLDSAKVRHQAASKTQVEYSNSTQILKAMWKEGGFRSLFKGSAAPIASLTLLSSLNFGVFDKSHRELVRWMGADSLGVVALAGGFSGGLIGIVNTPFEVVKVRAQIDNINKQKYSSSASVARSILAESGYGGLWHGMSVQWAREFGFGSTYFMSYFMLKNMAAKWAGEGEHAGVWTTLAVPLSGSLAGAAAWAVIYPLDVLKTNVQIRKVGVRTADVARAKFRDGGIRAFYLGVSTCMFRAIFVHAIRFSSYELALHALDSMHKRFY